MQNVFSSTRQLATPRHDTAHDISMPSVLLPASLWCCVHLSVYIYIDIFSVVISMVSVAFYGLWLYLMSCQHFICLISLCSFIISLCSFNTAFITRCQLLACRLSLGLDENHARKVQKSWRTFSKLQNSQRIHVINSRLWCVQKHCTNDGFSLRK